jgi:hypothetical protein
MNPWWWVPIGLATWLVAGVAAALVAGQVLWRRSQALLAADQEEKPGQPQKTSAARLVVWMLQAPERRRRERLASQGSAAGPDKG